MYLSMMNLLPSSAIAPSAMASAIFLFILFFFFASSTFVSATGDNYCAPSSCGNLTNIRHPFRLKDDPPNCGDSNYELTCDGLNRTILTVSSNHSYYVTNITYRDYSFDYLSVYFEIQVMYVGMERYNINNNSSCSHLIPLPASPLTPSNYQWNTPYYLRRSTSHYAINPLEYWVTMVNCSKEVKNKSMHHYYDVYDHKHYYYYRPVACLSHDNNSFIYLFPSKSVRDLMPSCRFLAMYPAKYPAFHDQQPIDIFKFLAQGLTLSGAVEPTKAFRINKIPYCLTKSIRETYQEATGKSNSIAVRIALILWGIEFKFLDCMGISNDDMSMKRYHLVPSTRIMLGILLSIARAGIVFAVLGRCIFAPLIIFTFLSHKLYQMMSSIDIVEKFLRNQQTLIPTRYSYTDIIAMTSHFKEKLGQGGFGSVFKGRLPFDKLVAIKMLTNSKHNTDGTQRALIYEYMANGSLDKFIFSSNNGPNHKFSLDKLIDIALGVARGLDYLHKGCDMQILHFDIKPHNILLDHNFNPKVSDFGLAKLYPKNNSLVSLGVARGTIGYIAPELISRSFGVISHKCDVYSFGMLLLEMTGGRRNSNPRADNTSQVYYPSWIYDKLVNATVDHDIVKMDTSFVIDEREKKLCIIGLWCIQIRPSDRPSMNKVIEMLEGDIGSLQMPPKPFFSEPTQILSMVSYLSTDDGELTTISEDANEIN
ncbi:cysteine-rich receptor-like protein kinase 26 isoform X2 [Dioscorea cayenensis subsp. rotundata]|uniref:Cysteine-rich receptor-like protein kinase 26 isoform X2 n=1 Tax=Dioscorea cayennensis subsp. rotundata TaxID=55577 RepID=A0AB40AYF7_DIOCR|nr:cysteine-rich receptor-like protein kinase 26 isoform X2 [Dioscorea cayenensis subsp. rotundata]